MSTFSVHPASAQSFARLVKGNGPVNAWHRRRIVAQDLTAEFTKSLTKLIKNVRIQFSPSFLLTIRQNTCHFVSNSITGYLG